MSYKYIWLAILAQPIIYETLRVFLDIPTPMERRKDAERAIKRAKEDLAAREAELTCVKVEERVEDARVREQWVRNNPGRSKLPLTKPVDKSTFMHYNPIPLEEDKGNKRYKYPVELVKHPIDYWAWLRYS